MSTDEDIFDVVSKSAYDYYIESGLIVRDVIDEGSRSDESYNLVKKMIKKHDIIKEDYSKIVNGLDSLRKNRSFENEMDDESRNAIKNLKEMGYTIKDIERGLKKFDEIKDIERGLIKLDEHYSITKEN